MGGPLAKLAQDGRPIIGCLPLYPPEELIHSFGAVPAVLWGFKDVIRRTPEADGHIQNYVCSIVRNVVEFLLTEDSASLSGLLYYNACDPIRNLPEIIADGRKLRRMGMPAVFRIHVPVQALGRDYGGAYLAAEIRDLVGALERFFKADFSPDRFIESVSRYDEMRRLARRIDEMVARGAASFSEFSALMMENTRLGVEERIARLSAFGKRHAGNAAPKQERATKRVVLSGIHPPSPEVISMIEAAGMTVVGNDIAALSRSYGAGPGPTGDPADYYVRFYRDHFPCTTLIGSSDTRVDRLLDLIDEREAAGLIVIGEKFCEYEYFEIPNVTRRLGECGIKTLVLEISAEDKNLGPIKTRVEAFGEMIPTP
jgi:benzoyl-CoA reductase/2-hydroxyglutaryl-CoA dehydratase subunit BcrC/BadD/HgdB